MTLLNTLTRKTARVRMERKLTVSKTKVFVPKLVGTKICRPVSSSLTLVPAVVSCCRRSPPPPAILACHLILKHGRSSRRYLFCIVKVTLGVWPQSLLHQILHPFNHPHPDICLPSFPFQRNPFSFTIQPGCIFIFSLSSVIGENFDQLSQFCASGLWHHMQQQKHPEHAHIFIVGTMAHFQKGPTDYLSFYKNCFVWSGSRTHITQTYSLVQAAAMQ